MTAAPRIPRRLPLSIVTLLLATALAGQVTITTPSLASGNVSGAYNQSLAATGGTPPYAWRVSAGALPQGLFLDPAGTILGTPLVAGAANPTLEVSDALAQTASQPFTLTVTTGLTIVNTGLSEAVLYSPYTQDALHAAGGTSPYAYSVLSGALPPGVSLTPAGLFSGSPTSAGDYPVVFRVVDGASATATANLTLSVIARPVIPEWNSQTLFGGRVNVIPSPSYAIDQSLIGQSYNTDLYASTDRGFSWSLLPGSATLSAAGSYVATVSLPPTYRHTGAATVDQQTIFVGVAALRGVYKSTNRGQTFTFSGSGLNTSLYYVKTAISDQYESDHVVWAAGYHLYSGPARFYKSVNGGATWTETGTRATTASPNLLVATPGAGATHILFHADPVAGELYRTADDGASWSKVFTAPPGVGSIYILSVVPSPAFAQDRTVLLVDSNQRLFRSVDGGLSFARLNNFAPGFTGCFVALAVAPRLNAAPLWYCRAADRIGVSDNYGDSFAAPASFGLNQPDVIFTSVSAVPVAAGDPLELFTGDDDGVRASFDRGRLFAKRDRGLSAIPFGAGDAAGQAQALQADNTDWYFSGDGGLSWTRRRNSINQARSIAVSPNFASDRRIFVAGSQFVYDSTDGGNSFTARSFPGTDKIVLDRQFTNGSGVAYLSKAFGTPVSPLMRSLNGAATFQDLPGFPTAACGATVRLLVLSPNHLTDGTMFTVSGDPVPKLCKSVDSGVSWSPLAVPGVNYGLSLSPTYDEAGANGTPAKFVYLTDSNGNDKRSFDGGATWLTASGLASSSQPVFISPNFANDGVIFRHGGGGLRRSADFGATFPALGAGDELRQRGVVSILFLPGFDGNATVGSVATLASSSSGIWRTTDGGRTFHPISNTQLTGGRVTAVAATPPPSGGSPPPGLAPGSLVVGTADQGAFLSADGGRTFSSASTGLPLGALNPVTALAVPSAAPGAALAALPGRGLWKFTGGAWTAVSDSAVDPLGSYDSLYDGGGFLYALRSTGVSARSPDGGATWQPLAPGETQLTRADYNASVSFAELPPRFVGPRADALSANTAPLWAVTPAGGPRWSADNGASWTAAPGGNDYPAPTGVIYSTVSALGIDPVTGGRIVVAGTTSGLWRSADGGLTWRPASGPGSGLELTSLNFSAALTATTPAGATDLLVGATGATSGGVYLSADGGRHWTQINQGFDPANLSMSSLVKTSCAGCPVQYYSGTYGSGVYTRTISVNAPPVFPALNYACSGSTSCTCGSGGFNGPQEGGQPFKLCGTGFQNGVTVEFDGVAATGCAQTGGTVVTCTATPAHVPGNARVVARNPDTRAGALPGPYAYLAGTPRAANSLRVAKAGANGSLTWNCAGCTALAPARVYRAQDAVFSLYPEQYNGGTGGGYTDTGAVGTAQSYFWSVE